MIRFFLFCSALAVLSLAQHATACDPPSQFRQAPRFSASPGFRLIPIQGYQQQRQMMFAQQGYGGGVAVSVQRGIISRNRGVSVAVGGGMGARVSAGRGRAAAGACAT